MPWPEDPLTFCRNFEQNRSCRLRTPGATSPISPLVLSRKRGRCKRARRAATCVEQRLRKIPSLCRTSGLTHSPYQLKFCAEYHLVVLPDQDLALTH